MAIPDKIRKISEKREIEKICLIVPCEKTIPHANITMIIVRIAVARFESTFLIPILARMAVNAPKNAESKENISHDMHRLYHSCERFSLNTNIIV